MFLFWFQWIHYQNNEFMYLNSSMLGFPIPRFGFRILSKLTFWKHELENSSKLSFYSTFKLDHKLEKYLEAMKDPYKRKCFSHFRISNHNLQIDVGRYQNIPQEERLCEICNSGEIESDWNPSSTLLQSLWTFSQTFEVPSRMLQQTKLTKTLKYCLHNEVIWQWSHKETIKIYLFVFWTKARIPWNHRNAD